MLKVDKKFIDEFLGVDGELKTDFASPCKTYRIYSKGNKSLMVMTPLMHDFDFEKLMRTYKLAKIEPPTLEHYRRGKYSLTVFTHSQNL